MSFPRGFKDDGCTGYFDRLFGYDFTDLCREHDRAYCTRCNPPGSMTYAAKIRADHELEQGMRRVLPWWLHWTAGAVYRAVWIAGPFNAWDSCGEEKGLYCRHEVAMPEWMARAAFPEEYAEDEK